MEQLNRSQLENLNKDALIVLVSSLQKQLSIMSGQLDKANAQLSDNNKQIDLLLEQLRLMNQRHFGRHSEKSSDFEGQLSLFDGFNEAEALKDDSEEKTEITEIVISSYKRSKRKGKRDADLDGLPARIIDHTLSKEELDDLFPNGYKELPAEVYKRLQIIPETFFVDEHHVHIYASCDSSGRIVRAKRPVDLFENSIATPSIVASVINGKYVNALPIERQSRTFKTNGINLASNTLSNWVINSTDCYLSLIYDRMKDLMLADNKVIHADESPVKVMRTSDTRSGKQTYMWVYANAPLRGAPPVVIYEWQPSRRADHPNEFLRNFSGTLVTDGYQAYHTIADKRNDLRVAGCWVHARRPFAEFLKSVKPENTQGTIPYEAYQKITEIMHEDNKLDDLPKSDREKQRKLILKKKVNDYFAWAKEKYMQVAPNGSIGKALAYSLNQEKYLRAFLKDGDIPLDNNRAERAIRPFTIGRKNFVFIESENGAKASAMLYSIAETAKANNIHTYKYFELLLSEIPRHMSDSDLSFLDDLMPWSPRIQKECPSLINKSQV